MTIPCIVLAAAAFVAIGYLLVEYSLFAPVPRGLRILMYHKVAPANPSGLTVTTAMFDRQCAWLVARGYSAVSFAQVINNMRTGASLPERPVILTFDDGFHDFTDYTLPVLRHYNLSATVFTVPGCIGRTNAWDKTGDPLLSAEEMRTLMATERIEFGIHAFKHDNYKYLTTAEIRGDLTKCIETMNNLGIAWTPVLAFPYGAYPRKREQNEAMRAVFRELGIAAALRIGQRVNPLPIRDPFLFTRAKISGNDSMLDFSIKVRKGRRKLFG